MDYATDSNSALKSTAAQNFTDTLPFLIVAFFIWYVEASRRGLGRGHADGFRAPCVPQCRQIVKRYAPEAYVLLGCLAIAAALRSQGDKPPTDPNDMASWQEIRSQWPLLTTADTLFALQAMLRFLLVLSAILRPADGNGFVDASPLAGSPALFFLLAGICRVWLIIFSPDHALEGPLAGTVNHAFEVAVLPALLKLAIYAFVDFHKSWSRTFSKVLLWSIALVFTWRLSWANRLPLADDSLCNAVFTAISLLELIAAAACFATTLFNHGGCCRAGFASFAHVILPIQQAMSFYFFLTAFDPNLDKASVGTPLVLLQQSGATEIVLLLGAGVVHFVLASSAEAEDLPAARLRISEVNEMIF
eukprot:TRINITY_DN83901_c0_g1_i1.p1 TRINITY_DN83901_c0_g1~~TRINITY_DN83901_c0_g1_i1.p1  ORF type:complete len:361 (+),score=48.06 TRINITY_DN83901_c0_g1_i1:98-1180(+)